MEKIRVGIVGIGNMGMSHASCIHYNGCPDMELKAVCDIQQDRLDMAKSRFGEDLACFTDAIAMMDSGLIDAVIIAVPHYGHPIYAMEAFKRGLHVMIEKPAGVFAKKVREMNEAAEKADVTFAIMFNQRTNCVYRKLKEIIDSGEMGQITRVNWIITSWYRTQAYYNSGTWRATWSGEGGGVLLNQCPHQLDLLQWICGLPVKVDAHLQFGKYHDIEVEDDVTAYLEFANGATGVFVTTTGDAPGTNRLEITMELGKLVVENDKLYRWKLETDMKEFSQNVGWGQPPMTYEEVETDGQNPQHAGVLNAFAGHILRGTPLVARGEEGIRGLSLSNAMHLSAFLGHPVDVPVDEDVYYEELMKRVATSRRKEEVHSAVADISGSFGGVK